MSKFSLLILLMTLSAFAQEKRETFSVDADYFRGNIYKHTEYISHLITGHPDGVLLSFNKQTYGDKEWQQSYNYPDYGVSLQYQNFESEALGESFAVGVHYNFYFLKRHLVFRISQGIGMATNPYDKETNYKNNAFGSKFMSSNLFMLNYKKENLVGRFGVQGGLIFAHFSNGRIKSPNSGINTYAINVGVNYNLSDKLAYVKSDSIQMKDYREPIRYNLAFRTGVSESQVTGSGQKPFYHISVYADKRLGRKSALQFGTELFLSRYLKEFIRYSSIAFPDKPYLDPETDYKRLSVFAGHELFVNRLTIEAQVGYYVYKPFKYESDLYQRVGAKYYITPQIFTGVSLKAHGGRAEALEVGLGVRL
ncbi:MAG: acyloxyacyl hydrolase [Flavobacterium sp.]|nr:acyloxyacyl hydrolase [Flavobacterium sp.]